MGVVAPAVAAAQGSDAHVVVEEFEGSVLPVGYNHFVEVDFLDAPYQRAGDNFYCQSAQELCPNIGPFKFQSDLTGVVVEIEWTTPPETVAYGEGPSKLRVEFEPLSKDGPTYWQGSSPGRLVLENIDAERRDASFAWSVFVDGPFGEVNPYLAREQPFRLLVSSFYNGAPIPADYSALKQAESLAPPAVPEAAPPKNEATQPVPVSIQWNLPLPAFAVRFFSVPAEVLIAIGIASRLLWSLMRRTRRRWWLGGFLFFARLRQRDVFQHEQRARMIQIVNAEPGVATRALQERMGLVRSVFRHHVRVLERYGALTSVRTNGHSHLYPNLTRNLAFAPTEASIQARILEAVQLHPGSLRRDLSELLGISERRIRYHTLELARSGQLRLVAEGGFRRCFPESTGSELSRASHA